MGMQLRTFNKILDDKYSGDMVLYKGDGYFYFEYSSDTFKGLIFETRSVYVNTFSQLSPEIWLEEAAALYESIRKIYNSMEL